jgi:hypothetical protein
MDSNGRLKQAASDPAQERIFVRFASPQQKIDALQNVALPNAGTRSKFLFADPDVLLVPATDQLRKHFEAEGAEVFDDIQFKVMPGDGDDDEPNDELGIGHWSRADAGDLADGYSMLDVMEQIRAPEAWRRTRGEGVTIVVVDTGIAGS